MDPDGHARGPWGDGGPRGARGPREWWGGLASRQRRVLRTLSALGVIVVIAGSVLLARFLSVENAERDDEEALVQAEVKGNVAGMLDQLSGCRLNPSCVARVKDIASNPRLHRAGGVKILQLESKTAYSLSGAIGETRLAWTVIGGTGGAQPVVQCVDVRRTGNFLVGIRVHLIALSAPISGEGKCTKESTIEREEEEATAAEQGR